MKLFVFLGMLFAMLPVAAESQRDTDPDARRKVDMPPAMRAHMLLNMRNHLVALSDIQAALAHGRFDAAAEAAENRLGMTGMVSDGASHLAPYLPQGMQDIGSQMHRAASRFARDAQEAAFEKDTERALESLAEVTRQCVACHAGYRVQ